jgi:hypothetical protein
MLHVACTAATGLRGAPRSLRSTTYPRASGRRSWGARLWRATRRRLAATSLAQATPSRCPSAARRCVWEGGLATQQPRMVWRPGHMCKGWPGLHTCPTRVILCNAQGAQPAPKKGGRPNKFYARKETAGIVRFCAHGKELGRLPAATARFLHPLLVAQYIDVQVRAASLASLKLHWNDVVMSYHFQEISSPPPAHVAGKVPRCRLQLSDAQHNGPRANCHPCQPHGVQAQRQAPQPPQLRQSGALGC